MFTAAKGNEFKDEAEAEGLVQDIKALNYSRKPRYSAKRREGMSDSSADEMTVVIIDSESVKKYIPRSG